MGKSKRIRSDRARLKVENPEKYESETAARRAKVTSIILICVIAAIIIITVSLVAFNKSGSMLRMTSVYKSDNYKITGTMATYMYYYTYNTYYSYYGQYTSYFVTADSLRKQVTSSATALLAQCEAARAAGLELGDIEKRAIDRAIDSISADAKASGYSISIIYGGVGVSKSDIRNVLELQYLANKYTTQYSDKKTDEFSKDDVAINKYFLENRLTLQTGDYISVSTSNEDWIKALKAATTEEEFRTIFAGLYAEANIISNYEAAVGIPAEPVGAKLLEAAAAAMVKKLTADPSASTTTSATTTTAKDEEDAELNAMVALLKSNYTAPATGDLTGKPGITSVTTAVYEALATKLLAIEADISKNLEGQSDKAAYITSEVASKLNGFYDYSKLASDSLITSFAKAAAELADFMANGTEIEGVEMAASKTLTAEMVKKVYEAKYKSSYTPVAGELGLTVVSDEIYKNMATGITSLQSAMTSAITVKDDFAYPKKEAETTTTTTTTAATTVAGATTTAGATTAAPTTTTAATTTAAATTTTAGTTTEAVPADEADLKDFNKWFFLDDTDEVVYVNEAKSVVYFSEKRGVIDTSATKNVGHILVSVDSETAKDTSNANEVASVEAENEKRFEEARNEAQKLLDQFLAGTVSKEAFEELANKNTDDSGVFYYNVKDGDMVEAFNDWIFDSARKAGDTGLVRTDYGYHVMYFLGDGLEGWKADTVDSMVAKDLEDHNTDLQSKYGVSVNNNAVSKLGETVG